MNRRNNEQGDQIKGRAEEVKGKVKEVASKVVGNKRVEAEGDAEQVRRQGTKNVR
jgi:uncharacterized protein YjbJ (UPF0337 family)